MMNRNHYLQEFKNGLSIFEESYQQEKVLELEEKISKLVEQGKSEEEALEELGDVTACIESILHENHVNLKNSNQKNNFFAQKAETVFDVINHVIDVMSKNSAKANGKILFDIFILIVLVCIIKIPFILLRDLGESLLAFLAIPFIVNVWHLIVEIVYIVIAVFVFLNIFKRWFAKLKVVK